MLQAIVLLSRPVEDCINSSDHIREDSEIHIKSWQMQKPFDRLTGLHSDFFLENTSSEYTN